MKTTKKGHPNRVAQPTSTGPPDDLVLVDAKKYYIRVEKYSVERGVFTQWDNAVDPDPLAGHEAYDVFLHRAVTSKDQWDASQGHVGLRIGVETHRTKAVVAERAEQVIRKRGPEVFWRAVNEHLIAHGPSPRYRKEEV